MRTNIIYIKFLQKSTGAIAFLYTSQIYNRLFGYFNKFFLNLCVQLIGIKSNPFRKSQHALFPYCVVSREQLLSAVIVLILYGLKDQKVLLSEIISIFSAVFHAQDRCAGNLFIDLL